MPRLLLLLSAELAKSSLAASCFRVMATDTCQRTHRFQRFTSCIAFSRFWRSKTSVEDGEEDEFGPAAVVP
jgi:hypothetical protein